MNNFWIVNVLVLLKYCVSSFDTVVNNYKYALEKKLRGLP